MKYPVLLLTALFLCSLLSAQPTLTKEETIRYIDKKMKETIGHQKVMNSNAYWISDAGIRLTNWGRVELRYSIQGKSTVYREFNPAHILSIDHADITGSVVGTIDIRLIGKTAVLTEQGKKSSVHFVCIDFLQTHPSNYNRLQKALKDLRDLYKAKENSFVN